MLPQMVFPVECARLKSLLFASRMIVGCEVILGWLKLAAVHALALTGGGISNDLT
jgi:hypothetical protein